MIRKQKSDIPSTTSKCMKLLCPYNQFYLCDNPRNNKGNSDALCHKENNKDLIKRLS